MHTIGVIPARFASSRFPGKPLLDLCGKTMLRRVIEAALQAKTLDRVLVATDDDRIAREAENAGAIVVMPTGEFASGTDRIAAAIAGEAANIVVNIQGDEPLLPPALIDNLVRELLATKADVVTPVAQITMVEDIDNPSVVKAVVAANGRALYFSRSAVPHFRGVERGKWIEQRRMFKHIGIYAYRRAALERFVVLAPSPLEEAEQLEQLRLLEDGAYYHCIITDATLIAIDTPADAEAVREVLKGYEL